MKNAFNQVILANMVLDLALATACLRGAGRSNSRRRAHTGDTSAVRTPPPRTGSSESTIPTTRGE